MALIELRGVVKNYGGVQALKNIDLREGHTIVMVTHDPEVGRMAQRRVILEHGRLRASNFPN